MPESNLAIQFLKHKFIQAIQVFPITWVNPEKYTQISYSIKQYWGLISHLDKNDEILRFSHL